MKIGKILIGSLLASSSIGNASGTVFNSYGLEKTLATTERLDYYNGFTEIKPQISQVFTDDYRIGGLTPITYSCAQGCAEMYQVATAACFLIFEPISQALCHAAAAVAYAACLANC